MRYPLLILVAVAPALGQDKRQYHLFNPTPREQMRALSTDRPDTTESPYTVDAGHVQVECSFVEYSRDRDTEALALAPFNFKIGLTNFADVQFVLAPYGRIDEHDGDAAEGFGDSQIRLKINLWGNDGGDVAGAIMPFVQFPTGEREISAGKAEYGLIFPVAIALPNEFGLTVMAEFDAVRNADDDGYRLDFVHTAALGRTIVGSLGGFIEYIGVLPFGDDEEYQASLAGGFTYGVSDDVQLDLALQAGLTDAAEDFAVLAGVSFRF